MFLRVSTYEHDVDKQPQIEAWIETITDQVGAIEGLLSVEVFESTPDEGVIVAIYEDEHAFETAAPTIKGILGDLGQFLTGPPVTASGSAFWSVRR